MACFVCNKYLGISGIFQAFKNVNTENWRKVYIEGLVIGQSMNKIQKDKFLLNIRHAILKLNYDTKRPKHV